MASVEELCDNIALINKSVKILDGPVKEIKRQYFTNSYQVQYKEIDGTPFMLDEPRFDVIESSVEDGICHVTFRLPSTKGPNDLLAAMLPHVNVLAFNELIPSMNDIFISTVNAVNANYILES
jgi:ABC-2 type transport system ATP-binding protein